MEVKTYSVSEQETNFSLRVPGLSNRAHVNAILNALHWVLAYSRTNYMANCHLATLAVSDIQNNPNSFHSMLGGVRAK